MNLHRTIPFWTLRAEEVFKTLESGENGLSETEATKRLKELGANTIETKQGDSAIKIFFRQFQNPLIIILIIAAGLTIALGDLKDAIFIVLAVLINSALGFYQENKAEKSLRHLTAYVTRTVRIERDALEREVDAEKIAPGDLIHVSQGSRIPADCRLLYSNDLQVDQSILTGESLPAEKQTEAVAQTAVLADRTCMLYSGTLVVQGFGQAIVTATGGQTELGAIARLVAKPEQERTPLQAALNHFTARAAIWIFLFATAIFFVASSSGISILESFLISVAVLVAAVPEGLPIVMTVILAVGVERLAQKNGVVRKLSAAETLGSTSVILTDKTGTLTQAKMKLEGIKIFIEPRGLHTNKEEEAFLLQSALLNVDAIVENPEEPASQWRIIGKPVEQALVAASGERGIKHHVLKAGIQALHVLPFNSLNKFSASIYQLPDTWIKGKFKKNAPHVLSMLGAPDILLEFCDLSEAHRASISATITEMAHRGERVLGVAIKELDEPSAVHLRDRTHLRGLQFLGTISFRDPLRPGVRQAISEVEAAGIRVVIVTGDHAGPAVAVAAALGLVVTPAQILSGEAVEKMTIRELMKQLPAIRIISRISPLGKLNIVRAYQALGETVAMTGDGINDAPALKQANIGVAMGSGTDVSKDVANLVLLDDNFETIVEAIKEGRRIIQNIRKGIVYLTSTILNEIVLIGGSLLLGVPLPINPLQILWVNFFTDSFPGVSLAFESKIDTLGSKPASLTKGIFTGQMKFLITINGAISSFLLLGLYIWLLNMGHDPAVVRTFIFAAFSTYSLFLVFAVRSLRRSIFEYNPLSNGYLVASVLFGFILTLAAIAAPALQDLFATVSLPAGWLFGVVGFGFLNILLVEFTKLIFRKKTVEA